MTIKFLGHSTLLINTNDKNILVDPFISANPLASDINIDELEVDYILITHAHYDHILDVDAIAKRTNATIIANHEISTHYQNKGFNVHGMNCGGSWKFDFGKVKMVQAIHSSSFPDGAYGGTAAGFVIENTEATIYIAGDTALHLDMQLIPLLFNLDLAVLPIGGNYTMDVSEALVAADYLQREKILGVHYDTNDLIKIDKQQTIKTFAERQKQLLLLNIGEKMEV